GCSVSTRPSPPRSAPRRSFAPRLPDSPPAGTTWSSLRPTEKCGRRSICPSRSSTTRAMRRSRYPARRSGSHWRVVSKRPCVARFKARGTRTTRACCLLSVTPNSSAAAPSARKDCCHGVERVRFRHSKPSGHCRPSTRKGWHPVRNTGRPIDAGLRSAPVGSSSREDPRFGLWKRGDVWHYSFWFEGRRYSGTTRQTTKNDAAVYEQDVRRRLRRQAAGLERPPVAEAPRFQDWAEVHFRERSQHMSRPEFLEDNLRV